MSSPARRSTLRSHGQSTIKRRSAISSSDWGNAEDDQAAVAKADLRERIRRFAFTRRGRRGLKDATKDRARPAYAKLQARDQVIRHAWLFANQWVEVSADEIEDENFDFSKRDERIHKIRAATVRKYGRNADLKA
jgi:hypothetical protein